MINDLAVDSVGHKSGEYGTFEKINGLAEPVYPVLRRRYKGSINALSV
jgi:hypothetical protein